MMPLSRADRAELDRLGVENVRLKMAYAGPGPGSVVPGLASPSGQWMTRSDVEDWLAEQGRKAERQQAAILWWAKAAAWVGAAGIVVAIVVAVADKWR
jgi:hypothetical protein